MYDKNYCQLQAKQVITIQKKAHHDLEARWVI